MIFRVRPCVLERAETRSRPSEDHSQQQVKAITLDLRDGLLPETYAQPPKGGTVVNPR